MNSHFVKPSLSLSILVGIVAGIAGIATAQLVAGTSDTLRSPVLDVGDRVVDNVPSWVKDLAIDWFGTNDKIALLAGIAALLTVFAGFLGVIALRSKLAVAIAGAAMFGLVGALSALSSRTDTSIASVLPSLIGAVVVGAVLWWSRNQTDAQDPDRSPSVAHPSHRRRFLAALAAISAVSVAGGLGGRRLEQRFSAEGSRNTVALAQGTNGPPAVPAGAQATNAAPFFTPNADFYRIDTALTVPQIAAEDWTLTISGMVDTPMKLTYDELIAKGLVESDITLTCVSNLVGGGLVGTARWQGIRLDQLLEEAGIDPNADQIVGRSTDGYTCGFPVAALDGRDALVAVAMNGEPLPLEHGFPARLIVPGIYGYASATKWLTEIEITRFDAFDHYWVPRGYSAKAPIKMQTRIDAPRGLDRIDPGPFAIGGVAWAQPTGIKQVEVQIDDGPWMPVDMATEVNTSTWRQWSLLWDATPGRHTITARAIDNNGTVQTAERDEPLPNGVSGHHSVVVLVNET
jgi:DMSO/TMAO reductase YedYZ molybdopterin-dependent catalytic subunit